MDSRQPATSALTIDEAAALSGLSRQTVTALFEREPGVLVLSRPSTMNKRRYRTMRIPRAVYARVVGKLTQR